ncbi:hypothetical protein QBC45DRAFT_12190 [Copromyces sp. CBS 386.78]|nr:hypothetical protein QBC45DRAFT_12190 [Copromyces sp. CBS 386.78]
MTRHDSLQPAERSKRATYLARRCITGATINDGDTAERTARHRTLCQDEECRAVRRLGKVRSGSRPDEARFVTMTTKGHPPGVQKQAILSHPYTVIKDGCVYCLSSFFFFKTQSGLRLPFPCFLPDACVSVRHYENFVYSSCYSIAFLSAFTAYEQQSLFLLSTARCLLGCIRGMVGQWVRTRFQANAERRHRRRERRRAARRNQRCLSPWFSVVPGRSAYIQRGNGQIGQGTRGE